MKTTIHTRPIRTLSIHTRPIHAFLLFFVMTGLLGLFTPADVRAEVPPSGTIAITEDRIIDLAPDERLAVGNVPVVYNISDGVTLTIQNGNRTTAPGQVGGVIGMATVNTTGYIKIGPSGPLGTGQIIFENNAATSVGAAVIFATVSTVEITNAVFKNNSATNDSAGGAVGIGSTDSFSASMNLTRVLFEGNRARSAGAIRVGAASGTLSITSGTFLGNYAVATANNNGGAGALFVAASIAPILRFTDVAFIKNRASNNGGVFLNNSGSATVVFTDIPEFKDNWAVTTGGAIYDMNNSPATAPNGTAFEFVYTGTTEKRDFVFSGNVAGGVGTTALLNGADLMAAGDYTAAFSATAAKSGGFYYAGSAGWLKFDIAEPVTLSIGKAGNPAAFDSIATANVAVNINARLDKSGAGRLILHADNSYFHGTVNVNEGSLLLGNQDAQLGGIINVASGATFGGSGTLVTHNQDGTVRAGRTVVTAEGGAFIQAGNDTAADSETLTISGSLFLNDGATLSHDLFTSGSASLLKVEGNLVLQGTGTINLGVNRDLLETGSFTLAVWTGSGLTAADVSKLSVTLDGLSNNPHISADLSVDETGRKLIITNTVNNIIMKWTGAEGANWGKRPSLSGQNWLDNGSLAEKSFINADSVVFDGETDAANPDSRDITIAADGVIVAGMEVSGTALYTFRGDGGITANAGVVGNATFTPSGKLKKSGEGELVFANTAPNTFQGGIEMAGGMITFDNAAQLGAGSGEITFSDSGTLRAAGVVSGTLMDAVTIVAGKTAELVIGQGAALVYGGTLVSAADSTLRKTGDGTLLFAGDGSGNAGMVALDAGALVLTDDAAVLGGNITVNSGVTLSGVGAIGQSGSVTISAGVIIEVGVGGETGQSGTLTFNNLKMTGDVVLKLDLFKVADGAYLKSDRIFDNGTSAISGTNIIDLTSFASGTFNLGNITGLAADSLVMLNGISLPEGGRSSAELRDTSGTLELVTTADQSRVMTWTGGSGATWNRTSENWTDDEPDAVNQYAYGDRILFDGVADAGHPENRIILIDAGEVRAADIIVSGSADYTFTGGGIHTDADSVEGDENGDIHIEDASGKLIKTGNGVLTLLNAKNAFSKGIDMGGGVLAFSRGDQLATSDTTGITFTGNSALRAAVEDVVLDNTIVIETGVTGAIDTNGYIMTLRGTAGGTADSTFAKDGEGTLVLEADMSGHSGTLAVREGVLRAGAADVLTATPAVIVVDAGAVLDLGEYNQTLSKLSGVGTVELGTARLAMKIDSGDAEFAGGFSGTGAGTVVKQGAGRLTLSGSSSHTSGVFFEAGDLGLAGNHALGTGALTVGAGAGKVYIEADGLDIANRIVATANSVSISAADGCQGEFSGNISSGTVTLEGSGTIVLSGSNANTSLTVKNARTIARRLEAIPGAVTIEADAMLAYENIRVELFTNAISGAGTLLFASSTLALNDANKVQHLVVDAGALITAITTGALGGAGANVTVGGGGRLRITNPGTLAGNMTIDDGGAVVFGVNSSKMGSLTLSGTLQFINNGEIRLDGIVPTGIYDIITAAGGILNLPAYNPDQGGMFMVADIVDGKTLGITAYNKALEPGLDIVTGFDALGISMRAVSSHISDELIVPLIGRQEQKAQKSIWFREIGTFAKYKDHGGRLGHTDETYDRIMGYDWISMKNIMLGGYFGYTRTELETTTDATTSMKLPHAGLYGAARMGDFYITANLAYGLGGADTERREDFGNIVKGSYDLDSIGGDLEIGYVLPFSASGKIRPSIGIQHMNLSFHDYAETGTGAVRLDDLHASSWQGTARLEATEAVTMPWGLPGVMSLGIGWTQSLHNERTEAWATLVDHPDARLHIRSEDYDRSGVTLGLGLRMMLSKSAMWAFAYDFDSSYFGAHNNDAVRHTISSMIRISW